MLYGIIFTIGFLGGGFCVFLFFQEKRRRLNNQAEKQHSQHLKLKDKARELTEWEARRTRELTEWEAKRTHELTEWEARRTRELAEWESQKKHELEEWEADYSARKKDLESRLISYEELEGENRILKRDLQNIDVSQRKLQLDIGMQNVEQKRLAGQVEDLGKRYLDENVKWIGSSITPNNYTACKTRLDKVIGRCREIGFDITSSEEEQLYSDLKKEYERSVRAAFEREEQARIRAQIREEQRLEKEIEREMQRLDRERAAIQAALERALEEAEDKHSEEVERLRARLAEAEERSQRAKSMAQMTRSGHVYVISNIGSFGEEIFKVGMTRRLEPMERITELSSASVPFPYDVHMMISADDAPTLENTLHRALHKTRINKACPRKEFFKVDIETIRQIVEEHHGEVQYVADPEALEYRQSLEMSDADSEYIESVYESLPQEELSE